MVEMKRSLPSRLLAVVLAFAMFIGMVPSIGISMVAATNSSATVESMVGVGTVDGGIVTFGDCVLDWSIADASAGRWTDGWWAGIKVVAPEDADIEKAQFRNKTASGWGAPRSFKDNRLTTDDDDAQYIALWARINEGQLVDAVVNGRESLECGYQFDWNGDGVYEQPVSMKIEPQSIVLRKNGKQVYPEKSGLATVDAITDGVTVSQNGGNFVTVENSAEVELTWLAKDATVGRTEDGWWIGYQVVAPASADIKKATYQNRTATGWDVANTRSFDTTKNTPNSIQVWQKVNELYLNDAKANNTDVSYITRYDWNGDGVYEQVVTLNIDPYKVVLLAEDGEQVYPYLGSVVPLTGGEVLGTSADQDVRIEEVTLNWSAANAEIGYHTDGWWVGVQVTAPEGYTAQQLNTAYYNSRTTDSTDPSGWGKYQKVFFKDVKDSEQKVRLWMVINPALIRAYQEKGMHIKTEYAFDWDGNGTEDQTFTLTVVPGEKIVLNKVSQTDFGFKVPNPKDHWAGEPFTNKAEGGQGTGKVTYAITFGSDVADIDEESGKLTFKGAGDVVVTATKAGDDTYLEATATYTIKAIKNPQAELKFESSNANVVMGFAEGSYINKAVGGSGEGAITYRIVSGGENATIDEATGKVTFIKAGKVTVVATKAGDPFYLEATATYTLTIEMSQQEPLVITYTGSTSVTYSKAAQNVITVSGGSGEGRVTYSVVSGNEYATIDEKSGAVTTLKAGGSFVIQVNRAGDGGYYPANVKSEAIYVNHADQTGFAFTVYPPTVITYDENNNIHTVTALGGESSGVITYAFADAQSDLIADIDGTTGVLTVHASGTINIVAKKAGDDCYKETTALCAVKVEKAVPQFSVEDVYLVYGIKDYQINVNTVTGAPGQYLYSIDGVNRIGACVDDTGKITFTNSEEKVGSVTIVVKRAEDDRYVEVEKTITLTVSYHEPTADPIVSGATKNESGWYTGTVTIAAPEGYMISTTNEREGTSWSDSLTINTDGVHTNKVFLKKGDEISGEISLKSINIDTAAPVDVEIRYETPFFEKVLQSITFGVYQAETVLITLVAEDSASGLSHFTYNIGGEDIVVNAADFTKNENGVTEYSFTLSAQFKHDITMTATDIAGWTSELTKTKHVLVLDTISPLLNVKYDFAGSGNEGDVIYCNDDVTVIFEITEENFTLRATDPEFKIGEISVALTWTYDEQAGVWRARQTLSEEAVYELSLRFGDTSGNEEIFYGKTVVIDRVAPVFTVTYDHSDGRNGNYYNVDRTATVKIAERNFSAEDVSLTVTAKDITGKEVDISAKGYEQYARNADNWSRDGDVWTLNSEGMKFDIDAIYSVELFYGDLAANGSAYADEFVIDKTPASDIKITYSKAIVDIVLQTITFGIYQPEVTVTVTARDDTAGVECFVISYTKEENSGDTNKDSFKTQQLPAVVDEDAKNIFTAQYTIPACARGTVCVELLDKANNGSQESGPVVLVVDDIAPTREVSYTPYKVLDAVTLLKKDIYLEGDNSILYYQGDAVVTFKIKEANFDLSLLNESTKPVIKVNGTPVNVDNWANEGDVWTGTYTISGEGDYIVTMTYKDLSTNEMVAYESCKIVIDTAAPEIGLTFSDGKYTQEIDGCRYYKNTQTLNVTVKDSNFCADDFSLNVTAKDIQGRDIQIDSEKYEQYLKNRSNWVSDEDVHTLVGGLVFDIDGIYSLDMEYDDIADHLTAQHRRFVIDHEDPTELSISYSTSIVDKVFEVITFGFYQADVTVTVTANDTTSGVDFFEWSYNKEKGASDQNASDRSEVITSERINYSPDGLSATTSFTIPANARGYISATATDRAGNTIGRTDENRVTIVVDDVNPVISLKYEADDAGTKVHYVDANEDTVEFFDRAQTAYYNGNVTATIEVNEANFFEGLEEAGGVVHTLGIKLRKTDNQDRTFIYEYLPVGANQRYSDAIPVYFDWTHSGDLHILHIPYTEDADYVLEIDYTDFSANEANITGGDGHTGTRYYESKMTTVDKIDPVVTVEYSNDTVIHTIDGRDYFSDKQIATITVREHNFRTGDFEATVLAKDILGEDVDWSGYSEWKSENDIHTLTIYYEQDANYTFDYVCEDLACNEAAEYAEDLFTVDGKAPENLKVTYSTGVLDKIMESITFGFYNAEMTVTISAEDDTSGIHYFVYSYIKSEDVSDVNTQLINDKISDANGRIVRDGKTFTTSFTIPKLLTGSDNQFNGTVRFEAFDRSEQRSEKKDDRRVIVDNIAPTATISYNEPVQTVKNVSYYAGNIDATIVINEANFYSEDVVVRVNDEPVEVSWVNNSTDIHTGKFTLTEDGDYVVTVAYKDRSNNVMQNYTSNRLTLDTTIPTVKVTNIKQNSANKEAIYGFTVTADDINLDDTTFRPVLTATIRNSDGSFGTKDVFLGDMKTVAAGKTYAFTVDNLEEDAVYSLTCSVKDLSGNVYSKVVLDDGQEYSAVRFSVNRNGSTFAIDQKTADLVDRYYVYSVEENLIIEEVNVDPIEVYTVRINGKELEEGKDYTTSLSTREGEWSKRTYAISREIFAGEGEYSIVVESTDKANSMAYSDVKNLKVSFVVDRTPPALTISGLSNGGRYQVEAQTVTVIPTDDGGRLHSLKVLALDAEGKPLKNEAGEDISIRFNMSGEEFLEYLNQNEGKVTFTIPKGLENQIRIICTDSVGHSDGEANEYNETYTKVTVSQSGWVIFYANKPLFYGSIAGVVLLIGAIILLVLLKKRKKDKK